jgi:hypothetical protein
LFGKISPFCEFSKLKTQKSKVFIPSPLFDAHLSPTKSISLTTALRHPKSKLAKMTQLPERGIEPQKRQDAALHTDHAAYKDIDQHQKGKLPPNFIFFIFVEK